MKVAEALALRADLQHRLKDLERRLVHTARVREGEQPAESSEELQAEFERCASELMSLIQRINRTNASTEVLGGTLADALARRDVLKKRQSAFSELADAASNMDRLFRSFEGKSVSAVDIAAVRRKAHELAKEFRELDIRIQEADWQITLGD